MTTKNRAAVKDYIAVELEAVRKRSLDLLEPLSEDDLLRQHSPLMSPLVWDLAHVGNYEEQWLLGEVASTRVAAHLDGVYDAFKNPRRDRPELDLLGPDPARAYVADIRQRVLDVLDRVELVDAGLRPQTVPPSAAVNSDRSTTSFARRRPGPLLDDGFVYGMVVQHEHQHDETMTATLQLRTATEYPLAPPEDGSVDSDGSDLPAEVRVDGGPFVMGTDLEPWAYDNERPAHTVEVDPFWIDTAPVTNAAYMEFIADGGYDSPRWWSSAGWKCRLEADLAGPEFWAPDGAGGWVRTRFGRVEAVPPREPVQHVCWYEADAYARWAGKRLPTEAEWEKAVSWTRDGVKRRYPWGDEEPSASLANLSTSSRFAPAPAGSFPQGESPWGCRQMIGDVWEWTASDFLAYPGFRSFPYREYSEVFFGSEYKVLRGGSWATHPTAVRTTFRNWDYPIRRQVFSGFRCARDDD